MAMALGYEQIVKDKHYNIIVDDNADEPKVVIEDANGYNILKFKVHEIKGMKQKGIHLNNVFNTDNDLNKIVDVVYKAYH